MCFSSVRSLWTLHCIFSMFSTRSFLLSICVSEQARCPHFIISALWVCSFWIRKTLLIVTNIETWRHFSNTSHSTEVYLRIFQSRFLFSFLSFLLLSHFDSLAIFCTLHIIFFVVKVWRWCTWQYGVQGKSFHNCR